MEKKWIIVNSCGTRCFSECFETYEDGWSFLYSKYPVEKDNARDDELDEYSVITEDCPHQEYIAGFYFQLNN